MDWLLLALAFFNSASMFMVFRQRTFEGNLLRGMLSFAVAQIATELAWIWLPLQLIIALLLLVGGGLASTPGSLASAVLVLSWIGLVIAIRQSFNTREEVELALQRGLGPDYRAHIPGAVSQHLRQTVRFADFVRPFHFRREGVELIRDIPYARGGVRRMLDIYRPLVRPAEGCPVLLQIHGGAWIMGDKQHQGLPLMNHLAAHGWICVAINYRLGPSCSFPAELTDCKDALGWIRTHGHEFGMNPDFVAVTGGSAGGHLTALMGLTQNQRALQPSYPEADTSVQACIPFFGVYDFLGRDGLHPNVEHLISFLERNVMHCSPEEDPALWDMASPLTLITDQSPPFMTIHGTRDSLAPVAMARLFNQRLRATSNQASVYLELEGAEHAFELLRTPRSEYVCDGVHRFLEWVRAGGAVSEP